MSFSPGQAVIKENHIHGFLGYITVAATILTIGGTIGLILGQYERASRSLSTRQGVHKRRLVQLSLGLALACFLIITSLKYANPVARKEAVSTLARAHSAGYQDETDFHDKRATYDGHVEDDNGSERVVQQEVVSSEPGRRYIAVEPRTRLSEWLDNQLPSGCKPVFDIGDVLARWLPPFHSPADFWWSSEYYWGALIWLYFLSHETRLRALPWNAPVLLTLLSGYLSLSGSQCLLYALVLMSPVRDTNLERWTPYRALVLVPYWLHAASWSLLPYTSSWAGISIIVFTTGALTYTAFTVITWIHPRRLGTYHTTAATARKSRALTFSLMALPLVVGRIHAAARALAEAGGMFHTDIVQNLLQAKVHDAADEAVKDTIQAARSTFGLLADIGRANAMTWDVVLSAVVIGLWVALAEADPMTMFRCTLIPWLRAEGEVVERPERATAVDGRSHGWFDTVQQLKNLTRFARPDKGPTTGTAEAYVRKRGRPPKHRKSAFGNESGYALIRSKSTSRSPGRPRKSTTPSRRASSRVRSQSRARSQVRHGQHGWKSASSLGISVAGWEAAGVAWCLTILAGLGVSMLGAFGAEAADSM